MPPVGGSVKYCIFTENMCPIPVTLYKTSLSAWALAYCKVCQIHTFKTYCFLKPHEHKALPTIRKTPIMKIQKKVIMCWISWQYSLTEILACCVSDFNMFSGLFVTKLRCLMQMQLWRNYTCPKMISLPTSQCSLKIMIWGTKIIIVPCACMVELITVAMTVPHSKVTITE